MVEIACGATCFFRPRSRPVPSFGESRRTCLGHAGRVVLGCALLLMSEFAELTVAEICGTLPEVSISSVLRRNKSHLLSELEYLPEALKSRLRLALEQKRTEREASREATLTRRAEKRRRDTEVRRERRVRQRRELRRDEEEHDTSHFLDLPTEAQRQECHRQFIAATSNRALSMVVCAVCARRVLVKDTGVQRLAISDLPSRTSLIPSPTHPSHSVPGALVEGLLLERQGVDGDGQSAIANVCNGCVHDLSQGPLQPPPYSLANNLWVGPIPWQLQVLTFPEQQLIALLYPRVYVVKLFPKDRRAQYEECTLQTALRGNVSTYALNMAKIADMVDGRLMPRPPAILANLISITFVGRGRLQKNHLRTTYRVRRQVVADALRWLKSHNRYYYDIDISNDRLASLPEDDVPDELLAVVNQTEHPEILDQENDDYVPTYADERPTGTGMYFKCWIAVGYVLTCS